MYQQITLLVGLSPTPPIASGPPAYSCSTAPHPPLLDCLWHWRIHTSNAATNGHRLYADSLTFWCPTYSGKCVCGKADCLGANVKTAALNGPWGLDDASVDSTILHRATLQSNIALKYQHQTRGAWKVPEAQIQFRATVQMCSAVNSNTI